MSEAVAVEEQTRGLTQWERVVDVFIAPSATFKDIRRSASWWLPFLLVLISTAGVTFAIQKKVGWDQVVQNQIQMNPKMQDQLSSVPPDQQQARISMITRAYQYSMYASPVIVLVLTAFAALVLWATFNFGLGAQTTYAQMFCLWMYAALPRLLSAAIEVVRLWFGGSPEGFDLKEPVGTNLAYYLPDASPWLRTLLGYFDVISIWILVLLIIGGSIIGNVKRSRSAAVIIGWWLLIIIVGVAWSAAFS